MVMKKVGGWELRKFSETNYYLFNMSSQALCSCKAGRVAMKLLVDRG